MNRATTQGRPYNARMPVPPPFDRKPLIGMVHLQPLPGTTRFGGDIDGVIGRAVEDARVLADGGADGLMIENFFDSPFAKSNVPAVTVAAMTVAAIAVRESIDLPIG